MGVHAGFECMSHLIHFYGNYCMQRRLSNTCSVFISCFDQNILMCVTSQKVYFKCIFCIMMSSYWSDHFTSSFFLTVSWMGRVFFYQNNFLQLHHLCIYNSSHRASCHLGTPASSCKIVLYETFVCKFQTFLWICHAIKYYSTI